MTSPTVWVDTPDIPHQNTVGAHRVRPPICIFSVGAHRVRPLPQKTTSVGVDTPDVPHQNTVGDGTLDVPHQNTVGVGVPDDPPISQFP